MCLIYILSLCLDSLLSPRQDSSSSTSSNQQGAYSDNNYTPLPVDLSFINGIEDLTIGENSSSPPNSPPPAYSEQPPPYSPNVNFSAVCSNNAEPTVICRVCQQIIYIRGREQQRVVKCANCQEVTPIKPPPSGKMYIACQCNVLLICKATSTRIFCPRPNCKRTAYVSPAPTVPGIREIPLTCGRCHEELVMDGGSTNALINCSQCGYVSTVQPKFANTRAIVYAVVGIMVLALAVGVTVVTFARAKKSPGIYGVWIGGFLSGICFLCRSCYYCTMTVSSIEGDV